MQFFWISFLNFAGASLSRMCVVGFTVLDAVILVQSAMYALITDPAVLFFIGLALIKFPPTSTNNTIMYWFPLLDVARNLPI